MLWPSRCRVDSSKGFAEFDSLPHLQESGSIRRASAGELGSSDNQADRVVVGEPEGDHSVAAVAVSEREQGREGCTPGFKGANPQTRSPWPFRRNISGGGNDAKLPDLLTWGNRQRRSRWPDNDRASLILKILPFSYSKGAPSSRARGTISTPQSETGAPLSLRQHQHHGAAGRTLRTQWGRVARRRWPATSGDRSCARTDRRCSGRAASARDRS
jgi:hypothetical protein